MAQSQSYYRKTVAESDEEIRDRDLVVNCAGLVASKSAFVSDRPAGRKDMYLMYMAQGELSILLGGEKHVLRPGDMAVHSVRAPQYYSFSGEGELIYYWAHFTGARSEALVTECGLSLDAPVNVGEGEEISVRFRELLDSFVFSDKWQETEAAGQLTLLLAALGRRAAGGSAKLSLAPIRKSLSVLHASYEEPWTVSRLAAIEYMSPSRYCAVFRSLLDMSPKEYLIRLRMRNAMELISRTDLSIKEIARSVGYEDPLYFSRLFKKRTGVSPRTKRKGSAA